MLWLCGVFDECEFLTRIMAKGLFRGPEILWGFPHIDLVTPGDASPPMFSPPETTAVGKIDKKINVAAEC